MDNGRCRQPDTAVPAALTIESVRAAWPVLLAGVEQHPDPQFDLAGVASIDAAGLQLLVALKRVARQRGTQLRLCNHPAAVVELIELYGLGGWLGDPLVLPANPSVGSKAASRKGRARTSRMGQP